ncbi:MAG: 4Fe-4S dicluster domain-containing protein [Candidatus Omnitrophica bacterium]|nr:4Fe-4S dicluster domain-containing protein [Candidatus Omnitrophota bacterium]MDD5310238.1 4Fe-4S dicluster domain-containing protein [Candidatus Omnitrophota bacterium]MDD5546184.1 4Fe-4S dicluster domain-containing protein [Candidatus Omnitrophota bacterium]
MIKYFKDIITGAWSLIRGLLVTLRNLFSKAVTIQYPTQKLRMVDRYRGLVDLRIEKCIKCYMCVKICPTGCLSLAHKENAEKKKEFEHFKYNMELCCFCGMCDQVCPAQAIYMNKMYEIAVYGRDKITHIDLLNTGKYDEWAHPTVK